VKRTLSVQPASLFPVALVLTLFAWLPAQAATVTSFDRPGFSAALQGKGLKAETFDDVRLGPIADTSEVKFSASDNGTPVPMVVTELYLTSTGENGIGAEKDQFFLSSQKVTFSFTIAITAFAIDINTFATKSGAYVATLSNGLSAFSLFQAFPGFRSNGEPKTTGQFLGFSSSIPFSSVTISGADAGNFTLDTLLYQPEQPKPQPEPAPEPDPVPVPVPLGASLPLLLSALVMLAAMTRRRLAQA
jgi:hypothetical protein